MSNEAFLNQMQNMYDSLQSFSIENNILFYKENPNSNPFSITINNIYLPNLNPSLFLLKPTEIFHTLFMIELLPKTELTQYEINFINSYVNKYLAWNDKALELNNGDVQNEELNNLNVALNGFKIPIYLAYDPQYENSATGLLIQEIMNNHMQEMEQGKGNQLKLVRINQNVIPEENNNFELAQAGFSTLILIASAVAATCMYIAYFILGH